MIMMVLVMPDISMCRNETCPLKKSCYRYMAKPNEFRQAYSSFEWKEHNNHLMCDGFMSNNRED